MRPDHAPDAGASKREHDMIHTNHIFVLSEQGFAERKLRDLFCGCASPSERHSCTRAWGLGRRR